VTGADAAATAAVCARERHKQLLHAWRCRTPATLQQQLLVLLLKVLLPCLLLQQQLLLLLLLLSLLQPARAEGLSGHVLQQQHQLCLAQHIIIMLPFAIITRCCCCNC
jgi:hypothetical protein